MVNSLVSFATILLVLSFLLLDEGPQGANFVLLMLLEVKTVLLAEAELQ